MFSEMKALKKEKEKKRKKKKKKEEEQVIKVRIPSIALFWSPRQVSFPPFRWQPPQLLSSEAFGRNPLGNWAILIVQWLKPLLKSTEKLPRDWRTFALSHTFFIVLLRVCN